IAPARAKAHELAAETEVAQHTDAIGLQRDAGADLGQGRRLFVEPNIDTMPGQGIGGGGTTDATADDGHTQRARAYGHHRASYKARLLCPLRPPACTRDCRVLAMGSASRGPKRAAHLRAITRAAVDVRSARTRRTSA